MVDIPRSGRWKDGIIIWSTCFFISSVSNKNKKKKKKKKKKLFSVVKFAAACICVLMTCQDV